MKKFTILLFFLTYQGFCQKLTLQEAIQHAKENSPIAKQIRSSFSANQWRFEATKANLKPQLELTGVLPGFRRSINSVLQPDGGTLFRQQSQNFSNTTLSLSQNILKSGGTISVNSGISRIDLFNKNSLNQGGSFWNTSPLYVQFTQPLFRINRIKWNWEQEKISFDETTRKQLELIEDLSLEVTQKFFDLSIATLQLKNAAYNLAINDTIYNISKGRFGVGKIAENELLQVELGLMNARNEVEKNQLTILTSEKQLRNLLGSLDGKTIEIIIPNLIPLIEPNAEKAINEARSNRSDYKNLELQENQAKMEVRSAEIGRRFSADLNVSLGFNQTDITLGKAFSNLQGSQTANVNFTIPIYNSGRNRALVESAKNNLDATLERIKNEQNIIDLEVFNKVSEIKQLKTSLLISAKADTIAQKRYEVAKNRYLIGKIDITNLTIAQQEKDQAIVAYIQTLQQYWLAYFRLRRATLFDFVTNERIKP
ncbi:TolC family protein [Emticicia sp. SJ17W-69]|uniref:TolC family protein n=1 Tax=Emticicia sp. SJ17W-69 TaxID=3421657 RepID=UPI003EBB1D7E